MENTTYNLAYEETTLSVNQYTNNSESRKWVLIHNGVDVYHPMVAEKGSVIETIQPYIEVFDSREEAEAAFPNVVWRLELDEILKPDELQYLKETSRELNTF